MPLAIEIGDNIALTDTATNGDKSTVGEPSIAGNGERLFMTGNWYACRSLDGGRNWTWSDPFNTLLPSAAGGFCCDQLALFDPGRQIWIWILQYTRLGATNVFRLAICRDADFAAGNWHWWDFAPADLDPVWSNLWFDYPDAALSADHLHITFNMFNDQRFSRASIMRFGLDALAGGGDVGFDWWSTADFGSLRLTRQADPGATMYWGSHLPPERLRLFWWTDTSADVQFKDVDVPAWNEDLFSVAPDGQNWLARADSRILGGALNGSGTIAFMWNAGREEGRPLPFCRAVLIDAGTKKVYGQPDLWSATRAFAFPAISPNEKGWLGMSVLYGGRDVYPSHVVAALDPRTGVWRTAYAHVGDSADPVGRWGDYFTCRMDPRSRRGWIATGYTMNGGTTRDRVLPRLVRFGLEDPMPVRLLVPGFGYDAGTWRTDRHVRLMADTTGTGRADVVGFGEEGVYIARARRNGSFEASRLVLEDLVYATGWRVDRHPRLMADTTGDGRADMVGFGNAGVYVARANADGSYGPATFVVADFGWDSGWRMDRHLRVMADTFGEGRADIIGFGNAGVFRSRALPDGRWGPTEFILENFGYDFGWRLDQHPRFMADTTGDGRADIVGFGYWGVFVSRAREDGSYGPAERVIEAFHPASGWRVDRHPRFMVDTTGNGRADIVGFGDGGVYISRALADGTYGPADLVLRDFHYDGGWRVDRHPRFVADTSGDGRADLIGFFDDGVHVSMAREDGTYAPSELVVEAFGAGADWRIDRHPRFVADTNGDRRADLVGFGDAGVYVSVFRPQVGPPPPRAAPAHRKETIR